jgi:hypothetical protein
MTSNFHRTNGTAVVLTSLSRLHTWDQQLESRLGLNECFFLLCCPVYAGLNPHLKNVTAIFESGCSDEENMKMRPGGEERQNEVRNRANLGRIRGDIKCLVMHPGRKCLLNTGGNI